VPYYITKNHPDCKSGWAVVKADYESIACHRTKAKAIAQMVAVSNAEGIEPGGTHPRDTRKESMKKVKEVTDSLYQQVSGDEKALVDAMLGIVSQFGKFQSEGSSINAGYDDAQNNPNLDIGVKCGNCVFHIGEGPDIECSAIEQKIEENGACRFAAIPPGIVNVMEAMPGDLKVGDFVRWNSSGGRSQGRIDRIERNGEINIPDSSFMVMGDSENPAALITVWRKTADKWEATDRKVGHKFSTLTKIASLRESKNLFEAAGPYSPPQGVQNAAKRALKWIADGKAGSGFTDVGRRRASQLAAGEQVSRAVVGRMRSYFARHGVDRRAKGFFAGESGFPSPGRVAWDAWGGDAGRSWVNGINLEND
jgi:hypothetical protein